MRTHALVASTVLALAAASCSSSSSKSEAEPAVGLAPDAPWPKFRADAAQTARGRLRPTTSAAVPWEVKTGKGVFSSPVIGADGTTYIGSADRTFYAIAPNGQIKWQLLTGEIIDSSALLDDRGRVYFGSGDGKLYARDAATGHEVWTMEADDPSVNKAFIRWFEGNVSIGPSGTLYVPNDNFFLYAVDRDTGTPRWKHKMPDQTWSSPAIDPRSETVFVGNNNVLPLLGQNTFALDKTGEQNWAASSPGTIAASPTIAGDRIVFGGFDGFIHALDRGGGSTIWQVATRDHVYASAAVAADGTLIEPSADGTVYALDPATGAVKWTFDTPDPIRSSPAIDADGNIYFGGGDGRLWVLDAKGALRWSMLLVDDDRNDLNSSPALGKDGIVIASESGQVFGIPYDWCLRPEGASDARCKQAPPAQPASLAELRYVTPMGSVVGAMPDLVDGNGPITLALVVRDGGRSKLATLDASAVHVETTPPTDVTVDVAGDGKFVTIAPATSFADGTVLSVTSPYLVDHQRTGLKLSGGNHGGDVTAKVTLHTQPHGTVTLAGPDAQGAGATTWEFRRLALPLPTLLPSYNQIGFDSLHYLLGVVELNAGHGIAWMIGAKLADGENKTVVDPTTRALFPLELTQDGDLVTLSSSEHLRVEVTGAVIPFKTFRASARLQADTNAIGVAKLSGSTICAEVPLYGTFLQALGLCNPQTDALVVAGGANLVAAQAPSLDASVGEAAATRGADAVNVTLTGSKVRAADHVVAVLLVDTATGKPITLDYGVDTTRQLDGDGSVTSLSVPLKGHTLPTAVRAHVMVDTRPVATIDVP